MFDNPRGTPPLASAAGLEIVEAAGPSGEARALAERIKNLLLDGVATDQIVVAVRDADEESDTLDETLDGRRDPARVPDANALFANALGPGALDRVAGGVG